MNDTRSPARGSDLSGWIVVALRSTRQNAQLRQRVEATGAGFVGLPALRLLAAADPDAAGVELSAALACPQCIFTSPAAVRQADRLRRLAGYRGQALAIGAETASVLERAGVADVVRPATSMNSEGLLALPELNPPAPRVGLVSAPGGRELLAETLVRRGARLRRADVYRRAAGRLDRRHRQALEAADGKLATLLSSSEALGYAMQQLSPEARGRLLSGTAVASSQRLAERARASGFGSIVIARSARPGDLLAALQAHAIAAAIR